jgi:hypothetical protein
MGSVPKCPFTPSGPIVIWKTLSFLISIFTGTLFTGPCGIVTVTVPVIEMSPFVEVALDIWRFETTCLCKLVPSGLTITNLERNFTLPAWAPEVVPPVVLLVMFDDVALLDVVFDEPVDVAFEPVVAPPVVALVPVGVLLLPVEVELLAEPPTVAEAPPVLLLPVVALPPVVAFEPVVAPPVVVLLLPVALELSLGLPVMVWPSVEVPVELPPVEPEMVLLPPVLLPPVVEPPVVVLLLPVEVELLPVEVLLPELVPDEESPVELLLVAFPPVVLLVLLLPEVALVELLVVELLVELLVEPAAPPLVMLDTSRPFMYHDPD